MNIVTSTGLLTSASSKFTLKDNILLVTLASVTRAVNYSGIAFPTPNLAGGISVEGYFMLPQLPTSLGQAPNIKSGIVFLR